MVLFIDRVTVNLAPPQFSAYSFEYNCRDLNANLASIP